MGLVVIALVLDVISEGRPMAGLDDVPTMPWQRREKCEGRHASIAHGNELQRLFQCLFDMFRIV